MNVLLVVASLFSAHCAVFRSLDVDLKGQIRTQDRDVDVEKFPFVLECKGRVAEAYVETAQSSVCNARQQSMLAAFNLFRTELSTDQALHRKEMAACTGDFERHYNQLVSTLEACQVLN
jgi:hypothetical protein